ncbi:hypothetical protein AKO1_009039 [Acrasis kona]|uniref:TFIIS N-terminal domain-containing protein n=1 Tax=Acrasis kona TaxID=1008807 RepID=A0AAW2ZI40_9EUKA
MDDAEAMTQFQENTDQENPLDVSQSEILTQFQNNESEGMEDENEHNTSFDATQPQTNQETTQNNTPDESNVSFDDENELPNEKQDEEQQNLTKDANEDKEQVPDLNESVNDGEDSESSQEEDPDQPAKKKRRLMSTRSSKRKQVVDDEFVEQPASPNEQADQLSEDEEDEKIDFRKLEQARENETGIKQSKSRGSSDGVTKSKKASRAETEEAASKVASLTLITRMNDAYQADEKAKSDRKPQIHKLALLPEITKQSSKIFMHNALLNDEFLTVLAEWINLQRDGSLPNVNIRTAVLKILTELPCAGESKVYQNGGGEEDFDGIDKDHLKESKINKLVRILAEHPKEIPQNKRLANNLLQRWSRVMHGLAVDYSKLKQYDEDQKEEGRRSERLIQNRRNAAKKEEKPVPKNPGDPGFKIRAQVPRVEGFDYRKRPISKVTGLQTASQPAVHKRMNKKLVEMKKTLKK